MTHSFSFPFSFPSSPFVYVLYTKEIYESTYNCIMYYFVYSSMVPGIKTLTSVSTSTVNIGGSDGISPSRVLVLRRTSPTMVV